MVELAITLGLIFSLLSYEVFGLAAGGICGARLHRPSAHSTPTGLRELWQ
ncbi:MAG: hypothetical protein R2759_01845 [Bacteroidales bacterium]